MRTLSTAPLDPDDPAGPADLDNRVADGLEALRQRIGQRLRMRRGEWPFDTTAGTESVLGHQVTAPLAASVMTAAILEEGGAEVTGVHGAEAVLNADTRVLTYSARVSTVYGEDLEVTAPAL